MTIPFFILFSSFPFHFFPTVPFLPVCFLLFPFYFPLPFFSFLHFSVLIRLFFIDIFVLSLSSFPPFLSTSFLRFPFSLYVSSSFSFPSPFPHFFISPPLSYPLFPCSPLPLIFITCSSFSSLYPSLLFIFSSVPLHLSFAFSIVHLSPVYHFSSHFTLLFPFLPFCFLSLAFPLP